MELIVKSASALAILYGASQFPRNPDLPAFPCFEQSVDQFRRYLEERIRVPSENILNLFDSTLLPEDLREKIQDWVHERKAACDGKITDVFFFYVGHGDTTTGVFRMAGRRTVKGALEENSLSSKALKEVLYKSAVGANFYIILDCCFGAKANENFQDTSSQSPAVLYAAAGSRVAALANSNEMYTRFSDALFAALTQGVAGSEEFLSFRLLESLVDAIYQQRHPDDYVRPPLMVPNNPTRLDVLGQPVFPNPAFRKAPQHSEYYANWIRRNGVPEGIGPLTEEAVKHRRISTRLLREQGRVRKVETVNSAGHLAANYYNTTLLGGSQDAPDSQECSWELVYGEDGRVAREEARNAFGRLLYRCEYSLSDLAETTARYFLNLSDVIQPRSRSGAAFVKISRNAGGLDQRLEFFDGFEQHQPDDRGSYGQRRELSPEGTVIKSFELDRNRQPAVCIDGYAIAQFTNNSFGDTTSQAYFDPAGLPTLHKDGYHKAVIHWSLDGNLTQMEFFGVNEGERSLLKGGWASWKATYDDAGNQVGQAYFDLDGKPVMIRDGLASCEMTYDGQGRTTSLRYFDTKGMPAYSRDGVSFIAYGHDPSGQINEFKYFEADGVTPALDREGVSRITRTFDADGNVVSQCYWGADGHLTRNSDGIAGFKAMFDASGNQTSVIYLNVAGELDVNNSGIATIIGGVRRGEVTLMRATVPSKIPTGIIVLFPSMTRDRTA